jgi:adenylate kinase family enzyme
MRIVVVGTSGAGKTALATEFAAQLQLPHIELDAINWRNGAIWRGMTPRGFVRRVTEAIQAEAWVVNGN